MSALPPKADIDRGGREVRWTPPRHGPRLCLAVIRGDARFARFTSRLASRPRSRRSNRSQHPDSAKREFPNSYAETFRKDREFRIQFGHARDWAALKKAPHMRAFSTVALLKTEGPDLVAGAPGFEPGNGGIKIRCLTTWLRPNRYRRAASKRFRVRRADHSGADLPDQRPYGPYMHDTR